MISTIALTESQSREALRGLAICSSCKRDAAEHGLHNETWHRETSKCVWTWIGVHARCHEERLEKYGKAIVLLDLIEMSASGGDPVAQTFLAEAVKRSSEANS